MEQYITIIAEIKVKVIADYSTLSVQQFANSLPQLNLTEKMGMYFVGTNEQLASAQANGSLRVLVKKMVEVRSSFDGYLLSDTCQ